MANTLDSGVRPQEWTTALQERLKHPTCWKEVADVMYTNTYTTNLDYIPIASEPVLQTGTRGTAYGFSDFTVSVDQLTISTFKPIPVFIDRADLAQITLVSQTQMAELQGQKINEQIETAMLADHGSFTNMGDTGGGAVGLTATALQVSATNIDDIVRAVRREVVKANGRDLMGQNGLFFVWRPADFELLEQFAQANGFNLADAALKSGLPTDGYYLLGAYHYVSNDFTAGHVFAGVRKLYKIGILKETYGQIVITQDPNLQSGVGIISRVDYGTLAPTHYKPVLFDLNVV